MFLAVGDEHGELARGFPRLGEGITMVEVRLVMSFVIKLSKYWLEAQNFIATTASTLNSSLSEVFRVWFDIVEDEERDWFVKKKKKKNTRVYVVVEVEL